MRQRRPLVADDLAEEEVHALDGGGALVEGVDLGVADVLLHRVVLGEAGPTEDLQRGRQQLVGLLRAVPLDDRQQQVVEAHGQVVDLTGDGRHLDPVLHGRGVEHQGAHPLGPGLLAHEHQAHVRVVADRHAGRGLVGHLREVGPLDTGLGVRQGVEVAGRQRGDRLRADHHPGVLDDLEHLRDARVDVTDESADGRVLLAEGQLAGRGDLQAHLLLEVGDVDAVALAELARLGVPVELRDDEQRQALGAGATGARDADRARQHEVDDVLGPVPLGAGDEALDALDVPGAVGLLVRGRPARADVGAGVGLGQHHGRPPVPLDDDLGVRLLGRVAHPVQDGGEAGPAGEHVDGRVGAQDHLGDGPPHARRYADAAQVLGQVGGVPAAVDEGLVALEEAGRHGHRTGRHVEDGRVAVAVGEGRGQVVLRQARHLLEHPARGVDVQLLERRPTQGLGGAEHLEQVELDVAQVARVVTHGTQAPDGSYW